MGCCQIIEWFTHEVFSLLLREKLIGLPLVEKILSWRYTGFNVHSKVRSWCVITASILMPIGARCTRQGLNLLILLSLKMIRLMCLPKAGPR